MNQQIEKKIEQQPSFRKQTIGAIPKKVITPFSKSMPLEKQTDNEANRDIDVGLTDMTVHMTQMDEGIPKLQFKIIGNSAVSAHKKNGSGFFTTKIPEYNNQMSKPPKPKGSSPETLEEHGAEVRGLGN